jgi:hypothetical protein
MYILGNGAMLCRRSELWNEIIGNLEDQHPDCIGEHLMLRCQAHPDRLTAVQYPIDFKDVEEGGCGQPCETILPCGHQVSRKKEKKFKKKQVFLLDTLSLLWMGVKKKSLEQLNTKITFFGELIF